MAVNNAITIQPAVLVWYKL